MLSCRAGIWASKLVFSWRKAATCDNPYMSSNLITKSYNVCSKLVTQTTRNGGRALRLISQI